MPDLPQSYGIVKRWCSVAKGNVIYFFLVVLWSGTVESLQLIYPWWFMRKKNVHEGIVVHEEFRKVQWNISTDHPKRK